MYKYSQWFWCFFLIIEILYIFDYLIYICDAFNIIRDIEKRRKRIHSNMNDVSKILDDYDYDDDKFTKSHIRMTCYKK